jgi:hypothetical protein
MANNRRKSANFLLTPHFSADPYRDKADQWFLDTLMERDEVRAAAMQREICPTTGAEHMQIFIILQERKRLLPVVRLQLLGAPCNVVMGDGKWDAMRKYCTMEMYPEDHSDHPGERKRKEGHEALQAGDWPRPGKRNDLIAMVDYVQETKGTVSFSQAIRDTNGCAGRHPKTYDRLVLEALEPRSKEVPHTAVWYYGEGRIGKSWLAASENPGAYRKSCYNKWWEGYSGETTVIYDEFTGKGD